MSEPVSKLTVAEWLEERRANCIRLSKHSDREGWLEDASYFAQAIAAESKIAELEEFRSLWSEAVREKHEIRNAAIDQIREQQAIIERLNGLLDEACSLVTAGALELIAKEYEKSGKESARVVRP